MPKNFNGLFFPWYLDKWCKRKLCVRLGTWNKDEKDVEKKSEGRKGEMRTISARLNQLFLIIFDSIYRIRHKLESPRSVMRKI